MEQDEHVADQDSPLHLQQLKHTAAALLSFKAQSDSVTWVADTVPEFVKDAIQQGLTVADRKFAVLCGAQDCHSSTCQLES